MIRGFTYYNHNISNIKQKKLRRTKHRIKTRVKLLRRTKVQNGAVAKLIGSVFWQLDVFVMLIFQKLL